MGGTYCECIKFHSVLREDRPLIGGQGRSDELTVSDFNSPKFGFHMPVYSSITEDEWSTEASSSKVYESESSRGTDPNRNEGLLCRTRCQFLRGGVTSV